MRNRKGFTLIETMAAISLGLIGITAVASTMSAGIFTTADNRSRLYATNALREEMESLRRTSYDTIVAYGASSNFSNAQVTHLNSGSGTRTMSAFNGANIQKVTLTVSWRGHRGNTISQSVTTYVARRGLNGS